MTLIRSNEDVKQVLDMQITMTTLDAACQELRIDIQIPTSSAAIFKSRSFSPLRGSLELAKEWSMGWEIPIEWFLQDIRINHRARVRGSWSLRSGSRSRFPKTRKSCRYF
jgi:hypothetical protein